MERYISIERELRFTYILIISIERELRYTYILIIIFIYVTRAGPPYEPDYF